MTKFNKDKKVTKIRQGFYESTCASSEYGENVQSSKKISIKLYEELCS